MTFWSYYLATFLALLSWSFIVETLHYLLFLHNQRQQIARMMETQNGLGPWVQGLNKLGIDPSLGVSSSAKPPTTSTGQYL